MNGGKLDAHVLFHLLSSCTSRQNCLVVIKISLGGFSQNLFIQLVAMNVNMKQVVNLSSSFSSDWGLIPGRFASFCRQGKLVLSLFLTCGLCLVSILIFTNNWCRLQAQVGGKICIRLLINISHVLGSLFCDFV